jgi:hypothetical protein
MDRSDPDGGDALATAVAVAREDVERVLDDASSRSAVSAAEAAAQRFKIRADTGEAGNRSEVPSRSGANLILDQSLSRLDAIETAVMGRQDVVLTYLEGLTRRLPSSGLTDSATVVPEDEVPRTEEIPALGAAGEAPWRGRSRHVIFFANRRWAGPATTFGWFALVLCFVAIFLIAL